MKIRTKAAKGFTLVELLVVIAIIAGLAALSSPVVMKQLTKAKIVKAQQACMTLNLAIEQFDNDYNFLPYSGGAPSSDETVRSDSSFMNIMCGIEDQINYKQTKFFTYNDAKGGPGSYTDGLHISSNQAELYDPWGQLYYITLDYDLDGEITNPMKKSNTVNGKLAVIYSKGPDGEMGSLKKNKDNASNL